MSILVDRVENDKITFSVIAADIKCLWVKDNPGYLPNVFLLPLRQNIHLCTEIPINTKIIKISWNQAGKCITSKIIGFVVFWHTLNTSDKKLNISINHFWDCLNICVLWLLICTISNGYQLFFFTADESDNGVGLCGWLLTTISWGLVMVTLPFSLCVCFKVC